MWSERLYGRVYYWQHCCAENNIDPASKNGRQRAAEAIHRERKVDWIQSEKNKEASLSTATRPSVSTSTNASWGPTSSPSISPSNSTTPLKFASFVAPHPTTSLAGTVPASLIDPRLVLDGHDAAINDTAAQRLDSIISNHTEEFGEDEQAMGFDTFLENVDQSRKTDILALPGREFVEALSRINIVRNQALQGHIKSIHEYLPTHCPMGNSRDYPTLFVYNCGNCDNYSTQAKNNLEVHKIVCKGKTPEAKPEKLFLCGYRNCGSAYTISSALQAHIDSAHNWAPRKCNVPECTNGRVFGARADLSNHISHYHHPIEPPMRCSFPGCISTTLWGQMHSYKQHLKLRHHLALLDAQKLYLPENLSFRKLSATFFQPAACPIGGSRICTTLWKRPESLTRHLTMGFHNLRLEEARKITRKRNREETDQGERPL
jgi:hypothetical protein